MAPRHTYASERTTTVPEGCRDIETIDDVIVRTHTAVGKRLQAVATRRDGDATVRYHREDVDEDEFAHAIEELPPVPSEPGFVTYGSDDRQLLWLASSAAGIAIALDRDESINSTTLAEDLYDCGIGGIELTPDV